MTDYSNCLALLTHTDPIRLLGTRLVIPSTLSLPSRFAPSARLMAGVSPWALWLAGALLCHCTVWDEREGGFVGNRWVH